MGGKFRIAKKIMPVILSERKKEQCYVEPFLGAANTFIEADGERIGADKNHYLISMWEAIISGWNPPEDLSENEYCYIKNSKLFNNDVA